MLVHPCQLFGLSVRDKLKHAFLPIQIRPNPEISLLWLGLFPSVLEALIDPTLHLATLKSVSSSRGSSVEMASILRPGVARIINLPRFVKELRHTEDRSEAFKGVPYLASGSSTKIASRCRSMACYRVVQRFGGYRTISRVQESCAAC